MHWVPGCPARGGHDVVVVLVPTVFCPLGCISGLCKREPCHALSMTPVSYLVPFGHTFPFCIVLLLPLTQLSHLGAQQPQCYLTIFPPGASTWQLRLQQVSVVRGKENQGGGSEPCCQVLPPFQSLASRTEDPQDWFSQSDASS